MTAIGTHCYGIGNGSPSNAGNPIGGRFGNDYNRYLNVFTGDLTILKTEAISKLAISRVQLKSGVPPNLPSQPEGFWDVLSSVASVVGGPVFGMVSTAAGALLGQTTESAWAKPGTNADVYPGVVERAVLAEAALQTLQNIKFSPELEQLRNIMEKKWNAAALNIDALVAPLTPVLTECGLAMAVAKINKLEERQKNPNAEAEKSRVTKTLVGVTLSPESVRAEGPFVKSLLGPTLVVTGEEGFFGSLGSLLVSAINVAKPFVIDVGKQAIASLGAKLVQKVSGTESEVFTRPTPGSEKDTRRILQGAMMGDVALQALMSLDEAQLRKLELVPSTGESSPMDFLKSAVQRLGPLVMDVARGAVKNAAPLILEALTNKLTKAESTPSASSNETPSEVPGLLRFLPTTGASHRSAKEVQMNGTHQLSNLRLLDSQTLPNGDRATPRVNIAGQITQFLPRSFKLTHKEGNPDGPVPMLPPSKMMHTPQLVTAGQIARVLDELFKLTNP